METKKHSLVWKHRSSPFPLFMAGHLLDQCLVWLQQTATARLFDYSSKPVIDPCQPLAAIMNTSSNWNCEDSLFYTPRLSLAQIRQQKTENKKKMFAIVKLILRIPFWCITTMDNNPDLYQFISQIGFFTVDRKRPLYPRAQRSSITCMFAVTTRPYHPRTSDIAAWFSFRVKSLRT